MATPTQSAEYYFRQAKTQLENLTGEAYGQGTMPGEAKEALISLCDGLGHLSVGLRATYAQIAEMKAELAQLASLAGRPRP